MNNLTVVPMTLEHLDAVCALSRESFSVPWSRESIKNELDFPQALTLVALCCGEVCGFLNARFLFDEGDLNLIAVLQKYRRQKIGSKLLDKLFGEAEKRGVSSLMLEVRESNRTAFSFYCSFGFEEVGRRKQYYIRPSEDALLLKKQLKQ